MNFRDTTRDLIAQVEQQTGFMVEVVPDPVLATMSTVIMAGRRTLPAHVIRLPASRAARAWASSVGVSGGARDKSGGDGGHLG